MTYGTSYPAPTLASVFNARNFGSKSNVATDPTSLSLSSVSCTTLNCNGNTTLNNLNVSGTFDLLPSDIHVNSVTATAAVSGSSLYASGLTGSAVVASDSGHQLVSTSLTTSDASTLHSALGGSSLSVASGTSSTLSTNAVSSALVTATRINPTGTSGSLSNAHCQIWEQVYFYKSTSTTNECYIPLASKVFGSPDTTSITIEGSLDVLDQDGSCACVFLISFLGSSWIGRYYNQAGNNSPVDFQVFRNAGTSTYTLYVVLNHRNNASTASAQGRLKVSADASFLPNATTGWTLVSAPINSGTSYSVGATESTPTGTMYSAHATVG